MSISEAIVKLFSSRLKTKSKMFHLEDLYAFVTAKVGAISPGSADRIMRKMRTGGLLDYRMVDRTDSSYQALSVGV